MKTFKKLSAVLFSALLICSLFSGCSGSGKSSYTATITDETMIIAYVEECEPFLYTDEETGELTGFDVELIESTFDVICGDYTDYTFVQVEEGYILDDDICYTDEDGTEYSALIMCGGLRKDVGTNNEDYIWSENIIESQVVTVVASDSDISDYNDLSGAKVATVSDIAYEGLDANTVIMEALESVTAYDTADDAFAALDDGTVDAVVIETIDLYSFDGADSYTVLDGTLDIVEYGFGFASSDDYSDSFNEALYEMQSVDYEDGDTLTPIVETYFGTADVCVFSYVSE